MPHPIPLVTLLNKPGCHLCEEAKQLLRALQTDHTFTLHEINIATDTTLLAQYGEEIPVVFINGRKVCKYRIHTPQFLRRLQHASGSFPAVPWQRMWPWHKLLPPPG